MQPPPSNFGLWIEMGTLHNFVRFSFNFIYPLKFFRILCLLRRSLPNKQNLKQISNIKRPIKDSKSISLKTSKTQ